MPARSAGDGVPAGASTFPDRYQRAMEDAVALARLRGYRTEILLQDKTRQFSAINGVLHDQRAIRADRGMSRKVDLGPRREDIDPACRGRPFPGQNESRFCEIELARDLLHAVCGNAGGFRQDGQLIAADWRWAEDVNDVIFVAHRN
jgi:hypothetical protein